MIKLVRHGDKWYTQITEVNPPVKWSNIEQAAEYIETYTKVKPDTVDEALITMFTGGFNCAEFTDSGELKDIGDIDVQIL